MLPLDLHVLSLSLAFILSQDQTLRCWIVLLISSLRISYFIVVLDGISFYTSTLLYYLLICNLFQRTLFFAILSKRGCKGNNFYYLTPNIFQSFFKKVFFHFFSAFHLRYLSRLRVQKYCYKTYIPNVLQTFYKLKKQQKTIHSHSLNLNYPKKLQIFIPPIILPVPLLSIKQTNNIYTYINFLFS